MVNDGVGGAPDEAETADSQNGRVCSRIDFWEWQSAHCPSLHIASQTSQSMQLASPTAANYSNVEFRAVAKDAEQEASLS